MKTETARKNLQSGRQVRIGERCFWYDSRTKRVHEHGKTATWTMKEWKANVGLGALKP